ncbi:MAG TPA: GAF domain-containing protein, partial [Candidatus Saccharimonadales bacterium]|nr:GAF domain-containing protein [Candidatus Saccharimonadales bacterium]
MRDRASFPVLAMFEALLGWQQDPKPARRRAVGEALVAIADAVGAKGAYLDVDAPPLARLAAGSGSLTRRPTRSAGPDVRRIDLLAERGSRRIGSLWLDRPAVEPNLAVRAIEVALDAVWSRAELRHAADRLAALDAATRAIAGVLAVERVLQLIVDRARELVGARYAALGIVDEHGVIERFVTSGITHEQRLAIGPVPRGHGLLGLIVRENRAYRIPEIAEHPDSYGFPPNHPPMHSFLGLPIMVKGRSVGNFYLTNKRGAPEFSFEDQRLVEMFALHAGVAIENARLHEQVQGMAVVEERERIGRDLHDGIIQAIYGVGLSLEDVPDLMREDPAEATARIDRAIDSLNLTIRDIRNFIFGLRPELVEEQDLVSGLAALASELQLNTMIDVELSTKTDDDLDLPAHPRGELIKIVREALSNVARHS